MKLIRAMMVAAAVVYAATLASAVRAASVTPDQQQSQPSDAAPAGGGKGWTIPAGAAQEPNPLTSSPDLVAKGKTLFGKKCERCHGKSGKGDGPDADADEPPDDLTDASRASRNPDGVMFYKVWNGRKSPKMPAFKTELSKEDVWTVVTYAKTLRKAAQ
jgi:mono/diheme cytochrome c family protein